MKETFVRKITSRKLWVAVVGIVVGIAAAFGIGENEYAQIVGLIGAIASALSYVLAEASVDKANKPTLENAVVTDALEEAKNAIAKGDAENA